MGNKTILSENIFVWIGKMLALSQIKREIPKVLANTKDDAELQSAVQNFQHYSQQLDKLLPTYCKDHPKSALCKDYKSNK